jgi:hypothetical protein
MVPWVQELSDELRRAEVEEVEQFLGSKIS